MYRLLYFLIAFCIPLYSTENLDQKIGQLIIVGFRGMKLEDDSWVRSQIASGQIGGVILYDYDSETKEFVRNIESGEQLKALTASLQEKARIPLFIAADQEGGRVSRLNVRYRFPPTHTAYDLGQKNRLDLTRKQGETIAETLSQHGLNLNFAPDVDLNINPDSPAIGRKLRSFSDNPDTVANHAREIIRAHKKAGILTTIKHFPGHGSAEADTHDGFVDVTRTWSYSELKPFQSLIDSGDVDAVMTAHIFNAKLDPLVPATLSKSCINGILRNQLGFQGVVITDDLQMGAISKCYPLNKAIKLTLEAGSDILLFANQLDYDPEIALKAIAAIKELIARGEISEERIEQSYKRVMSLKERLTK